MCLFCFFWFQGQVFFCVEPDIFQHQHITNFHGMHGFPCMTPEYAVCVLDRLSQQLLELLCMCFKRGEIFFPGSALVGDNHNAAVRKCADCRKVLPEPFIIKNNVGGGIDGGVEIEPEEDGFSVTSQLPDGSNLHPDHLTVL